jgi:hypothetical protein
MCMRMALDMAMNDDIDCAATLASGTQLGGVWPS